MSRHTAPALVAALLVAGALTACDAPTPDEAAAGEAGEATAPTYPAPSPDVPPDAYVVDVVAEDFAFEAPDEILSGWTTFRFQNDGEETHFLFITRLPDDQTYDDYVADVGQPINDIWYQMRDEDLEKSAALEALGASIPAWYWTDVEVFGGPGMVVPGGISQATIELEPGTYVLECFMKTAEGEFHWVEGMIRPIEVLAERSEAAPPEFDVQLTLGSDGFTSEGEPRAGTNTVALTFAEQPDVGFGNDVHVVRLEEGVDPQSLVAWMDAFNLEGLKNPAPAPFVGGSHERKEGQRVYFSVDLLPGRYAWFSEGTDMTGGIYREFTVQ